MRAASLRRILDASAAVCGPDAWPGGAAVRVERGGAAPGPRGPPTRARVRDPRVSEAVTRVRDSRVGEAGVRSEPARARGLGGAYAAGPGGVRRRDGCVSS